MWQRDPWAPAAHLGLSALGFGGCAPALPWAEPLSAPWTYLPGMHLDSRDTDWVPALGTRSLGCLLPCVHPDASTQGQAQGKAHPAPGT